MYMYVCALCVSMCAVCVADEVNPDSVGKGSLPLHGAVGVQEWRATIPCLLLLHEEEELRGTEAQTRPTQRLHQICGQ